MPSINISLEEVETFCLVLARAAAIFLTAPLFGSRAIPYRLKAGLSLLVAMLLYPSVGRVTGASPQDLGEMLAALLGEIAIGVVLGYMASLIFAGVMMAGQLVGFQMGLGIANVIDPMTSSQYSVVAQFENIIAFLLFLAVDGHHWLISALAESFHRIPLGGFDPRGPMMDRLVRLVGNMFVISAKIGAPIIAISFFTSVVLGLVARTVPQINVFIVGFPLKIAMGLFGLGISLPLLSAFLKRLFIRYGSDSLSMIAVMGGP